MAIKYYQNGIGNNYEKNNWDPDLDYRKEYVNVYFRVETKGYEYPSFSFKEECRKAFDTELVEVFTALGWKCESEACNGSCAIWYKGKQHLYLHPQNFNGEVLKNEVKQIAETIEKRNTFYLRWVDLYETVYDMSDEEYNAVLYQRYEEMKKVILEACRTRRVTSYCYTEEVIRKLSYRYGIKRVGKEKNSEIMAAYIEKIIKSLITEGYLITAKDGKMIRTINKSEQKQRKIFIA